MDQIVEEVIEKVGESFHLLIRQIKYPERRLRNTSYLYLKNRKNDFGCIRRSHYQRKT
jgi:hypothetical protein